MVKVWANFLVLPKKNVCSKREKKKINAFKIHEAL